MWATVAKIYFQINMLFKSDTVKSEVQRLWSATSENLRQYLWNFIPTNFG